MKHSFYHKFFKRFLDIVLAFVLLILASPFMVICWFVLMFANSGYPFFLQPRPGKNGRVFHIIKFKTMNDKRDKNSELLPDAARLTKAGQTANYFLMQRV